MSLRDNFLPVWADRRSSDDSFAQLCQPGKSPHTPRPWGSCCRCRGNLHKRRGDRYAWGRQSNIEADSPCKVQPLCRVAGTRSRFQDLVCERPCWKKFNQFNKAGIFLFAIACFRDCNIGFLEKQIHDIVGFAIWQFISNHFLDHLINVALTSWSFWTLSVFPIEDYNSKVLSTQIAKICEGFSHICFVQLCKLIFQ